MPARSALEFFRQRTRSFNRLVMLRPITNSELLDAVFRIYRNEGRRMLALSLVPALLAFAGLLFYAELVFPRFFTTMNPESPNAQVVEVAVAMALSVVTALPLLLLGLGWMNGLVVRITADALHGEPADAADVMRSARSVLKNLFAQMLIFSGHVLLWPLLGFLFYVGSSRLARAGLDGLVVFTYLAGILSLLIAFIMVPVVIVRSGLAPVVCVVERLSPRASLARSKDLMRRRPFVPSALEMLLNLALLVVLVFVIVWIGLGAGMGMLGIARWLTDTLPLNLPTQWATAGLGYLPVFAAMWLSVPLWGIGTTLLYFDRRSRLEAYDIEMHAREAFPGLRDAPSVVR